MNSKIILICLFGGLTFFFSCKKHEKQSISETFEYQAKLDSLLNKTKDIGSMELNDALIRELQYQKKMKVGESNGIVIPKSILLQAINGFSESGINIPSDTSNYSKWDFLVVFPGLEINEVKDEKLNPVVYYYKGGMDKNGNFIPIGKPVTGLKFIGGGGGDGVRPTQNPPPTVP